jgi:hypothetical protein
MPSDTRHRSVHGHVSGHQQQRPAQRVWARCTARCGLHQQCTQMWGTPACSHCMWGARSVYAVTVLHAAGLGTLRGA